MSSAGPTPRSGARSGLGLIIPIGLVGAVLVLIAPVPAALLDLLLAANITAAVLILLQTVQVRRPLEFSVFPALLLATTLGRLVLNVASTRLILTEAPLEGVQAAGGVIAAFGEFVAAGSPYVGGVVFAVLVAIQFLVITKGATRISEVAARFALDGLPGRQSAIDADLAAGLLTPAEARERRQELVRQADFYGAMDGASKFVRGDAVAGLLITFVNIVGGLAIGVLREGMSPGEAVDVFTTLTIGDGLVSQVPAVLISLAAGLIVTRSSTESDLSRDAVGQLSAHPLPLFVAAGFLGLLACTGFPVIPMLALAAACLAAALWGATPAQEVAADVVANTQPRPVAAGAPAPVRAAPAASPLEQHLHVEPLALDLGVSLVRLADTSAGGDLLARITQLRERIAAELGFILPKVRIQDDLRLDPREFRIQLRGVPESSGTAYADALLAVNDGFVAGPLSGIEAVEPATRRGAVWIDRAGAEEARRLGYRLAPPGVVILQHLEQSVRRRASELLTREHVHELLAHLRRRAPRLVDDLTPARLSGGEVHRVLCRLLDEEVPIRDLESILAALSNAAERRTEPSVEELVSAVRIALRRTIVQKYIDERGLLHVVQLQVDAGDARGGESMLSGIGPDEASRSPEQIPWLGRLQEALHRLAATGHAPVVVCPSGQRVTVREVLRQSGIAAAVLARGELPVDASIKVHAVVLMDVAEHVPGEPESSLYHTQAAHLSLVAAAER